MDKKPFNLEKALAGEPVVTRGGSPVTQLVLFKGELDTKYPLRGVFGADIESWTSAGAYCADGSPNNNDLFMASTKKKGWVNIYSTNSNHLAAAGIHVYGTRAIADERAGDSRIACVEIEWEE